MSGNFSGFGEQEAKSSDTIFLGTSFQEVLLIKLLGIIDKNFINIDQSVGYYINNLNSKFKLKTVNLECMYDDDGSNKSVVNIPNELLQEYVEIFSGKEDTTSYFDANETTNFELREETNSTENIDRVIKLCGSKGPLCDFQYFIANNVNLYNLAVFFYKF